MLRINSVDKKKSDRRRKQHSRKNSGHSSGKNSHNHSLNASGHHSHHSRSGKASLRSSTHAKLNKRLASSDGEATPAIQEEGTNEVIYDHIPLELLNGGNPTDTLKKQHDETRIQRIKNMVLTLRGSTIGDKKISKDEKKVRRRTVAYQPDPGDKRAGTKVGPKIGTFIVSKEDRQEIARKLSDRESSQPDLKKAGRIPKCAF